MNKESMHNLVTDLAQAINAKELHEGEGDYYVVEADGFIGFNRYEGPYISWSVAGYLLEILQARFHMLTRQEPNPVTAEYVLLNSYFWFDLSATALNLNAVSIAECYLEWVQSLEVEKNASA